MRLTSHFSSPSQPFLSLLLCSLLWASAAFAVNLGDVFNVKKGTTEGGTDDHAAALQSWLDDTGTLVDTLLQAMPEDSATVSKDDAVLKNNLAAYFKIRVNKGGGINNQDAPAYTTVRDHIVAVDSFLKGNLDDFKDDKKPFLFVNSDWLPETEDLFDGDGDIVEDTGTGMQANVRNFKPANFDQLHDDNELKSFLTEMQQGTSPNWDFFAYYSKDIKDYLIEPASDRHQGSPPSFCNPKRGEDMFALTITRMLVDSVTICPDSFDPEKSEPFETIAEGLGSDAAKNEGEALQDTSPRGLTLFHELIHLTKDPDHTKDVGIKPTQCMGLITNNRQVEARTNPDNFVFFAWSYYLSTKGDPKLQWHTGISSK